jgi:hypothetical protein
VVGEFLRKKWITSWEMSLMFTENKGSPMPLKPVLSFVCTSLIASALAFGGEKDTSWSVTSPHGPVRNP